MDVFRTVNNRPNRISLFSKTRLNNSLTLRVKLLINIPLECGGGLNELDTLKANNAWQPKLFRTLWIILSSLSRLCNCKAILHGRVEAILSAFGSMKLDGNLHFCGSFINVTYCNEREVMLEKVKTWAELKGNFWFGCTWPLEITRRLKKQSDAPLFIHLFGGIYCMWWRLKCMF